MRYPLYRDSCVNLYRTVFCRMDRDFVSIVPTPESATSIVFSHTSFQRGFPPLVEKGCHVIGMGGGACSASYTPLLFLL